MGEVLYGKGGRLREKKPNVRSAKGSSSRIRKKKSDPPPTQKARTVNRERGITCVGGQVKTDSIRPWHRGGVMDCLKGGRRKRGGGIWEWHREIEISV